MKKPKLPALLLALALLFTLSACRPSSADPSPGPSEESAQTPSPEPSAAPTESPSLADGEEPDIRLAVLSGPTGVGAAKLLDGVDHDPSSLHTSYAYTIAADNSELVAGLTGPDPEFDVATVASNVAVNLYNKTDGGVKIIAVGTLGVLHILESGGNTSINSMADLAGRTIYAAGQGANPEYVLRYLLKENGLEDVEIFLWDHNKERVYEWLRDIIDGDTDPLVAKLLSGEVECAMLPVPAATAAIAKSEGKVRQAIDLTEAWDSLRNGSQLIMTAVVARAGFVEAHPDQVEAFLTDYEASIKYVNDNVDAASELVAGYNITPSAGIAKLAIPQCHLAFISGADMVASISDYYSVLYSIDPASVGGTLPDAGIYWMG